MIYGKVFNGRCGTDVNDKIKIDDLRVQAKHTEMVLQHFCNRFYMEYILALLEQHSLQTKRNSKPRLLWREVIFRKQRWESLWCRISFISDKGKENLCDKQTNTTFKAFESFRQFRGGNDFEIKKMGRQKKMTGVREEWQHKMPT